MTTIIKEIETRLSPEAAWDAVRDVGALPTRLARGFVKETALEEGARIVTFANGMVVKELIVGLDDKARRLAWSAAAPGLLHHNGSTQVFARDGGGARLVWIADVLPDAAATTVGAMMDAGCAAMKKTLDETLDG